MKSLRKITAWAMALAISSTATAVTAFADNSAVTTDVPAASEPVTTDIVTTEVIVTTTAIATEDIAAVTTTVPTTPVVSPVVSATFGTAEITVNTETKEVTVKDTATGMKGELKGSTLSFDGSVIQTISINKEDMTEETSKVLEALIGIEANVNVDTIKFSDNVTEVKDFTIGDTANTLSITFGKNIKTINPDLLDGTTAKVTIYGYKGTAAETFAAANNATFVALDESVSTNVTYEASAVTTTATTVTATDAATTKKATTASKKATTKKATTTAKASDSPKTGDSGVGLIAGILALSAVTGAFALRKKDSE